MTGKKTFKHNASVLNIYDYESEDEEDIRCEIDLASDELEALKAAELDRAPVFNFEQNNASFSHSCSTCDSCSNGFNGPSFIAPSHHSCTNDSCSTGPSFVPTDAVFADSANDEIIDEITKLLPAKDGVENHRVKRLQKHLLKKEEYQKSMATNKVRVPGCDAEIDVHPEVRKRVESMKSVLSDLDEDFLSQHADLLSPVVEAFTNLYEITGEGQFGSKCGKDSTIYCADCMAWFCEECHERLDPRNTHKISKLVDKVEMGLYQWHFPGDFKPVDRIGYCDFLGRCQCGKRTEAKRIFECVFPDYEIRDITIRFCSSCDSEFACLDMHGFRLLHQPSASGYSGWACALSVVKRVSRARSERVNSFVEFINEHNSGRDRFISPDKLMDIVTFEQQLQAGLLRPVICHACKQPDIDPKKINLKLRALITDAGSLPRDASKCSELPPAGLETPNVFHVHQEKTLRIMKEIEAAVKAGGSSAKGVEIPDVLKDLLRDEVCSESDQGKCDPKKDEAKDGPSFLHYVKSSIY